MSYPAGGNFLRLNCGVKRWVYISVATKLCCSGALLCGALLCGAVLLCYCSSTLLDLQHELLHHGLHCGVKQWVYTSVATKLCCSGALLCGALLCGAVLLCYCRSAVLELQHELLHHGVDPRGDTAGMCATWLPWPFSRTYLHRRAWRSRRCQIVGRILIRSTNRSSLVWSSVCSAP